MPGELTVRITETPRSFATKLNIEIASELNKKRPRIVSKLHKRIHALAIRTLQGTSEYQTIANGGSFDSLKAIFGFTDNKSSQIQAELPKIIADTLEITGTSFIGTATGIQGRWNINMIPSDYGTWLLQEEIARYLSITKGGKESIEIPWLDWLLRRGDSFVLADYKLEFGSFPGNISRSRNAIMLLEQGHRWSVPAVISGTVSDNWLTRTYTDPTFYADMERIIKLTFDEVL